MPLSLADAILRTVCYADIFDYPLTLPEIRKYLIGAKYSQGKERELKKKADSIPQISRKPDFYFLKGKDVIVNYRKRREYFSSQKMIKLKKILKFLSFFPFVLMIALTGTLAMNNADRDDDIDLLLVIDNRFIWTTRFFIVSILKVLGLYRNPKDKKASNKICLNMYLDENHLELPVAERDLYSAHEVIQLKPVYDKDGYYQRFRSANSWIAQFLPNSEVYHTRHVMNHTPGMNAKGNLMESFFRKIQLWKIKKNQTKEIIRQGYLRFHPHDNRGDILKQFEVKLKNYKG